MSSELESDEKIVYRARKSLHIFDRAILCAAVGGGYYASSYC